MEYWSSALYMQVVSGAKLVSVPSIVTDYSVLELTPTSMGGAGWGW